MAELSNHSYHYKSELRLEEDDDVTPSASASSLSRKSKKRCRRRKRMLTGVSKQRRAANERERKRLQIINTAFKDLKSSLPLFPNEDNISKIDIVRLASRTIEYLSDLVHKKNNIEHLDTDTQRSPGGSMGSSDGSSTSDLSSPDGQSSTSSSLSDLASNIDFSVDLNNILTQHFDISSLSSDLSSLSSTVDAFSGIDINSFINIDDGEVSGSDDVFPSMLYL